jgi:hypothetical protein
MSCPHVNPFASSRKESSAQSCESLSPNGFHARFYAATSNAARSLPPGCTLTITAAATPRSAANHPPPVCLACQVRTSRRGCPTGVILLLLSPSASPERVWLYAAELDEHLLAPHILISSRLRSRQHAHFRSFPRYPGVRKTTNSARNNRIGEIGNTGRATQDAPDQARPCRTAWGPGQMTPTNTDLGNPPLPNIYREIR